MLLFLFIFGENMRKSKYYLPLLFSSLLITTLADAEVTLEQIEVTTDFRPTTLEDSTVSVTVVTEDDLKKRGANHIEEVLNTAPNVNLSSGASRAHYFQIRGIGERSQFQTPINPSVGLYVDGIDFSRSGAAATLFDIEQVDVIRGPQGTKYGASALAGIINLKSTEPSNERKGHIESTIGNFGRKSLGIAVGGPLIKNTLLSRFSLHSNQSDGFINNKFLNRDNTSEIDELTARGHLKWLVSDELSVDLHYLHLDINNGYDAFTFDNSRNTLSDQPGRDSQKTNAFSIKSDFKINPAVSLKTSASYSDSDLEYSYDEDWSFVGQFDDNLFPYSSFDQYLRTRKNTSFEAQLLSDEEGRIFNDKTDWVAGLYYSKKSENLLRKYTFAENDFNSKYDTKSSAIYGQLDTIVTDKLNIITGLRAEQWDANYNDSKNNSVNTDELLYGGKLGLEYDINDNHLGHASISRGFKAGGVNVDGSLPKNLLDFGTEYLWNFEVGVNSSFFDDKLKTRVSTFYAKRKDQQVNSSVVVQRDDGSTEFTPFIANAAAGNNYGLEAELDWQLTDKLKLKTSLGLLAAEFDQYKDPQSAANGLNLNGRDQAHAPNYQYTLGAEYSFSSNLSAGLNLEGKDGFYFSDRHNARAKSYSLLNANVSYKQGDWKTTLWARNLLDKDVDVRGFGSFGNNPGNGYTTETYTQKGEPRTVGLTLSYDF
jgi:outer membrane receptor protein involved in Fe transport